MTYIKLEVPFYYLGTLYRAEEDGFWRNDTKYNNLWYRVEKLELIEELVIAVDEVQKRELTTLPPDDGSYS